MASMNSRLSLQLLLSMILSLICYCKASPSPSPSLLLSLNCSTPPPHPTLITNKLLSNLIARVTKTRFATTTINLKSDRFSGLMQCRPDISPKDCTHCARTAQQIISTTCPDSESVAAWFDGCYVQYYNYYKFSGPIHIPKSIRSNQTYVMDLELQFLQLALDALLLQLRTRIGLTSNRGFVRKEVRYGNNGSRIYGLAECVRPVSTNECERCVREATEMLYLCCSGRAGGVAVAGFCVVRFESHRFFSYGSRDAGGSDTGGGGSDVVRSYGNESVHEGCSGLEVKVVWAWGVVVACLVGIVLGAWLLRRKILNTARVATTTSAGSEGGHKDLVLIMQS